MIMYSKIHEISPEASVMYLKNCAEESENSNLVIAESRRNAFKTSLLSTCKQVFDQLNTMSSQIDRKLIAECMSAWIMLELDQEALDYLGLHCQSLI